MLGQQLDSMAYHVLPGDSLSKIIKRYYGAVSSQRYQAIIKQIQLDNPKVTNPNHIKTNQLLIMIFHRNIVQHPANKIQRRC